MVFTITILLFIYKLQNCEAVPGGLLAVYDYHPEACT